MNSSTNVIVGVVIKKDDKYLLVQEAKASCRGKWNLPAGHLDPNETIFAGAKREAKEETGCEVELVNICQIGNRVLSNEVFVSVIFSGNLIHENISFNQQEILDVRWFSYDEILVMKDQLRNIPLILESVDHAKNGITAPLGIVSQY